LLSHRKKAAFGSLTAEVRKLCAEKNDDIMEMLVKLSPLGFWVGMTDIVNLTLRWRTLQRNADGFEGLDGSRRDHFRKGDWIRSHVRFARLVRQRAAKVSRHMILDLSV
jgi:hypothetical protein